MLAVDEGLDVAADRLLQVELGLPGDHVERREERVDDLPLRANATFAVVFAVDSQSANRHARPSITPTSPSVRARCVGVVGHPKMARLTLGSDRRNWGLLLRRICGEFDRR
jgi:hypothetical protein